MPLLQGPRREFETTIDRTPGYRSTELDDVVARVDAYVQRRTAGNLMALVNSVAVWRNRHANEYANRLGASRLAFEAELGSEGQVHLAVRKEVFARYWHWNRVFPDTRFRIPVPGNWNRGTVVVDPWAAALGHPVTWDLRHFPASLSGMAQPLTLVMKSEDLAA